MAQVTPIPSRNTLTSPVVVGNLTMSSTGCISWTDVFLKRNAAGSVGVSATCAGASSAEIAVGDVLFSGGQALTGTAADITTLARSTNNQRFVLGLATALYPALNRSTTGISMSLGDGTAGGFFTAPILNATTKLDTPAWIPAGGTAAVTGALTVARGAVTSGSAVSVTSEWTGGGTFPGSFFLNVTDTSSAAGSLLVDWQVGGVSKFSVRKDGLITNAGSLNVGTSVNAGGQVSVGNGSNLVMSGRVVLLPVGVGKFGFSNAALDAGVSADVTTNGTIHFKLVDGTTDTATVRSNSMSANVLTAALSNSGYLAIGSRITQDSPTADGFLRITNFAGDKGVTYDYNSADGTVWVKSRASTPLDTAILKANTGTFANYNFNGTSGKTGTTCTAFTVGGCTTASEPNAAYFASILHPAIRDAGFVVLTADEYADFLAMRSQYRANVQRH